MVAIAILKLSEEDIFHLDMDEIIDYFNKFKDEENVESNFRLLKPYETIIAEAIKLGNNQINNVRVNQIFQEYEEK